MKVYINGTLTEDIMKPVQTELAMEKLLGEYFECIVISRDDSRELCIDMFHRLPDAARGCWLGKDKIGNR